MMLPTLPEAFRRAIAKGRILAPNGEALTLERITQILGNGEVEVRGVRIPVTGEGLRTLRAGARVAVAWEKGRPVVAIAHTAKRSGAPVPLPADLVPVIEELFLVQPEDTFEVWFRNGDQLVRLVEGLVVAVSTTVHWGTPGDGGASADPASDFFCVADIANRVYRVYQLNRPELGRPFPPDFQIEAELVRTYDLSADGTTFGTVAVACTNMAPLTPGGESRDIGYGLSSALVRNEVLAFPETVVGIVAIGVLTRFAGITPDGDLLLRLFLVGSTLLTAGVVEWTPNDPDPPVAQFATGFPLRLLPHCGAMLVNAKTGQILVNHTASVGISVAARQAGVPPIDAVVAIASYTVSSPNPLSPAGDLRLLSLRRVGETYVPDRYVVLGPPRVLVGDSGSLSAQQNAAGAQVVTLITPTGQSPIFTSPGGNVEVVEATRINGASEVEPSPGLRTAARDWVVFFSQRVFTPAGIPIEIRLHSNTSGLQRVVGMDEFPGAKLAKIVPGDVTTLVNLDDGNAQAEPYFLDPTEVIDLDAGDPPRDGGLDDFAEMAEIPAAAAEGGVILGFSARDVQVVNDPDFPGGSDLNPEVV